MYVVCRKRLFIKIKLGTFERETCQDRKTGKTKKSYNYIYILINQPKNYINEFAEEF